MIYTGQFGSSAPAPAQQQTGFNPYAQPVQQSQYNNMAPMYSQPPQYSFNNPGYYGMQNNNANGFVFQPVQQQPRYDYYNPFGNTFAQYHNGSQPQYSQMMNSGGYYQPYAQYGYNNFRPYMTMADREKIITSQAELMKIKFRLADTFFGRTTDEEALDKRLNPLNEANRMTKEEMERISYINQMNQFAALFRQPQQPINANDARSFDILAQRSNNYHKELDNHSLFEFLENDLWKLNREIWIEENIVPRSRGRNLSTTYDSDEFNELLRLHRSSNPYVNDLLDNSRYDNNMDDLVKGMSSVFNAARDREARQRAVLESKVPDFVSDEETQRRRNAWTNYVLNAAYAKGVKPPNV